MQTLIKKGKNYLRIDTSYLSFFVDGTEYDLVFNKQGCQSVKVLAVARACGNYANLCFEFNRCLDTGEWAVEIFEKNTNNLLHKTRVQISN